MSMSQRKLIIDVLFILDNVFW